MKRRRFLATLAGGAGVSLAGCLGGEPTPTPIETVDDDRPEAVGLETVGDGLQLPVDVSFLSGSRRLVVEQRGLIRAVDGDGLRAEPVLDIRDRVVRGFETGLLGIAPHPQFDSNRRLFVRYSAPRRPGTPEAYNHTFVLAEMRVRTDLSEVRPGSERTVLEIPQPQANHNAGSMLFGSDGMLYVGVGDGGGAGDKGTGHATDWYEPLPGGNGQDVTENLLGTILRLDVDGEPTEPARRGAPDPENARGYRVPADNPLVGREGLAEQYAWGLRNPWRLSVDGDRLYAGDVGQSRFEEINRVVRGGNYGWNVREGSSCFQDEPCPSKTPETVRGGRPFRQPVVEYRHPTGEASGVSGASVIIGNHYDGSAIAGLDGAFLFADYRAGGRLFLADPVEEGVWPTQVLPITDSDAGAVEQVLSIGRGPDGELYVLGGNEDTGGIFRLTPPES